MFGLELLLLLLLLPLRRAHGRHLVHDLVLRRLDAQYSLFHFFPAHVVDPLPAGVSNADDDALQEIHAVEDGVHTPSHLPQHPPGLRRRGCVVISRVYGLGRHRVLARAAALHLAHGLPQ